MSSRVVQLIIVTTAESREQKAYSSRPHGRVAIQEALQYRYLGVPRISSLWASWPSDCGQPKQTIYPFYIGRSFGQLVAQPVFGQQGRAAVCKNHLIA
jgi:hypothetical protein